jgi:polyhydroxyalkanoate synthesis regulator phasin
MMARDSPLGGRVDGLAGTVEKLREQVGTIGGRVTGIEAAVKDTSEYVGTITADLKDVHDLVDKLGKAYVSTARAAADEVMRELQPGVTQCASEVARGHGEEVLRRAQSLLDTFKETTQGAMASVTASVKGDMAAFDGRARAHEATLAGRVQELERQVKDKLSLLEKIDRSITTAAGSLPTQLGRLRAELSENLAKYIRSAVERVEGLEGRLDALELMGAEDAGGKGASGGSARAADATTV